MSAVYRAVTEWVQCCLYVCMHTGRTVRAERSAVSGLSVLKRAECRSVKVQGLDDLPHQQTVTMSREYSLPVRATNCLPEDTPSGSKHVEDIVNIKILV
jgi:hypothetical protein